MFLTACSSEAINLEEGIETIFNGLNGYGSVSVSLNPDWLSQIEYDRSYASLNNNERKVIDGMLNSVDFYVPNNQKLSNGDVVDIEIKISPEAEKYLEEGTVEVTVNNLKEGTILTEEQMFSAFHLRFYGRDGEGYAEFSYDDNFPEEYRNTLTVLEIENNGNLKNGEIARVTFTNDSLQALTNKGYGMAVPYIEREVTGLKRIGEKFTDIVNFEDVKRYAEETVTRRIADYPNIFNEPISKRDIVYMYRPYDLSESRELHDASLIKIYYFLFETNADYRREERYEIYEFYELYLDDQNAVNITTISKDIHTMDKSYSDETVIQYYQGLGYQLLEEGANE